jgi:uncharacterized protein
MLDKEAILDSLKNRRAELREKFSVKSIGLFGSFARGEETPASDLDFLVQFENTTFDNYMDLKFYLEDLFGAKADLVIEDSVKPRLKPYIFQEIIYA